MSLINRLPSGQLKVTGKDLTINGAAVKLRGTNLTYSALDWGTPTELATLCYYRGYNLIRFHKLISSLERQKLVADALYAKGIRFSIDGLHHDMAHLALKCYEMDPGALAEFESGLIALKNAGILTHLGLAYICLINEGFTALNRAYGAGGPAKALEFAKWAREKIRGLGCTALITDGPDGNIDSERYGPVLADPTYDLAVCHIYGTHPDGLRFIPDDWKQADHFFSNSVWFRDFAGKPTLIQEFGSLLALNRGLNEAYAYNEAARYFSGVLSFQWASNPHQMGLTGPSRIDTFSISTDYFRAVSEVYGSLAMKHWRSPEISYSHGAYKEPRVKKTFYHRETEAVAFNAVYNSGNAIVKASAKSRYVFIFEDAMVKGYQTAAETDWPWQKVTDFGGHEIGFWQGPLFGLAGPISSVTKLNPWTLKSMGSCVVSGNSFQPLGVGVYRVNLR